MTVIKDTSDLTIPGKSGQSELAMAASQKIKERDYWLNKLSGYWEKSCFPTDDVINIENIENREQKKEKYSCPFSTGLSAKLLKVSSSSDLKLHVLLSTGLVLLLHKYTGNEDIIIGSPMYRQGQDHGFDFINTILILRNSINEGMEFRELLLQMKQTILEAVENRNYPIEILAQKLNKPYSPGENFSLFDISLLVKNIQEKNYLQEAKHNITFSFLRTGENIDAEVEYNPLMYPGAAAAKIFQHFIQLLEKVSENLGLKLSQIDILSKEEKEQILVHFNDTQVDYPRDKTITCLFEEQVERIPDHIAVTGPSTDITYLTYRELNEKSNSVGHILKEKGCGPNFIVGIKAERSCEMIVAIFGILKSGGAYLPIDPGYPEDRINFMLNDSSAKLLINGQLSVFSLGEVLHYSRAGRHQAKDIAYIIYTSGSTGKPKGVMIEHYSVVNILFALFGIYPFSPTDTYLFKTSFEFDVSVSEIFGWFLGGGRLAILESGGEKDPRQIMETIKAFDVTHINFVPSMFAVFVDQLNSGNIGYLASLKYIFLAGEAILPAMVKKFKELNNPNKTLRLENIYGPTEGTIYASRYSLAEWPGGKNIPIGKPLNNVRLYIFDKCNHLCPVGIPGELYIAGDGVARGYLNRPELTAEKFQFNRSYRSNETHIVYKTGDLARWLPEGNIEFLGRIDHQTKIRGFRIELGEIENRLSQHPAVKETIVTANVSNWENDEDKYLCAYIVFKSSGESIPTIPLAEFREFLARELPAHMIPSYFVPIDKIPLTPSGKIDRKALPAPGIESGKDYIAPRDIVEEKLAGIWEDVLFGKASANEFAGIVGIDHNFFQMGGHSLKAVMILSKVHREFNVVISLNQLFKTPTIRGLSAYIKEAAQENFTAIKPVEKKEFYHLSSAQKRIYILWQLQPGSSVYNMPVIIPFSEKPDLDLFERTFFKLIERHESLRTSFHMIGDQPVQKVHHIADLKFKIEYYKEPAAQSISSTTIIQDQVNRSFELSEAPLIRAILIETKTGVEQYVLAIVMHHIVSDGISLQVMQKDFLAMLNGLELIPLEIQYKDFSEWQISEKEQEKLKSQELYWLKQFEEDIPVLDLPMDFNRPIIQKFEGSAVTFQLEKEETTALKELALNQGATLFMVLLAIFNVFLSRLSGQEDIVVGIPTAGRRHADLESVIGMFVNSLAIRNFPRGETLFNHFLNDLKERTLETFENQDYQFEDLVEKASIARNTGRNPLFDVMFTWNTQYGKDNENDDLASKNKSEAGGIEKQLYSDAPLMQTSKFDLTLTGIELDNVLHLSFQYSTKLFRESTVNRFIGYFKKIVGLIQAEPGIKLSHVQVISDEEKYRLLYGFNDTKYHFLNDNKTVHELFTGQAEKSGDRAAVVSPMAGGNIYITYRELQKKSDCLAQVLRSKGCGPGNIISIIVYPSLETIVGIMSILKTGGCYLPIDPTFPVGRIDFILADSECKLLLFQSQLLNDKNFEIETLDITDEMVYIQGNKMNLSEETTPGTQGPGNPIYMIYTSGTTGNPKGVVIKHESLINYTAWFSTIAHLTGFDRSVLLSSFAFDLGYTSIYPTILNGGQLHLLSKEVYMYPMDLLAYISRHRITYLKMTPSLFSTIVVNTNFSQETCRTLRLVLLGGEAINTTHVEIAYQKFENLIIMNHYGPTEATIGCIAQFIERSDWENYKQRPTIGKPIFNTKVYILDKYANLLPSGVMGELCIGGAGLARGYFKRDSLTAEKFIESPYGRYYRTGDLGRWLPNGKIEFLGRIDLQVKIRGFRVELAEIENRLANHPSVKESVVLAKEILQGNSADKYLCAYIVLKPAEQLSSLTPQEISSQIKEFLVHDLPEYMLPSYFIYIDKIPLTLNGKIDLKALPAPGLPSGKNYSAPRDIVEEKLAGIWADVLLNKPGNASASGIIGIDDNFFQVGGQSLKAVIMLSRVHRELHVKVPLSEVFKAPTIKGLANFVRKSNRDRYASIEPAEKKEYYALSSAQKRLYILQQINWQSTAYNMPEVIPLGEMADIQGLTGTFQELINRHESLRTSFHLLDDQPVQKVHDEVAFAVEERSGEPVWTPVPFDLAKAPLLRAVSMKNQANQHFLMVDMHHIISDGVSHAILLTDFIALYNGESLSPLRIQYKDFSEWQNSEKEKENLKKQETYWLGAFAEEIPVLELPADFARPVIQAFEGNALRFQISAEETKALKEMAFREGVTLYMLLLALYTVFIGKLSGQEDIVLGSPAAGRRHADLERILGVFINTLALRNYPVGEKSFSEFLKEVKVKTIEAFENQDYPFEDLVDKVVTGRDAGRNPLFDVMIILQNIESGLDSSERPDRSGGSRGQQFLLERETSKFDLVLNGSESNEGLNFSLAYSTRLFKRETVERFLTYLKSVFTAVLDDPQLKISNIEIIPEEEKKKILFDFNGTEVEYPWNKTIDRVFAEQVEKIPDHMAVFGHGHARVCPTCLTYHELNEQSGKLAGLLIEKGIQPDSIVAIMMERSVEMIIGIMGILKSGGAYLPIDPNYPQERIDYMLRDSHAKLLIINKSEIRNSKFETNPNDQKINDQNKIFEELMVLNFKNLDFEFVSCFGFRASDFNSSNLAYIIYTSGTTGRPKGVMVRHCNLANLVWGLQRTIYRDYPGGLHVCFVSPYIFDASVKQIFASLLLGHCLYVVPENVRLDGVLLLNYYEKYKIDISDGTPTHLRLFLESMTEKQKEPTIRVKHFLIGGEALPVNLMVGFFDRLGEKAPKVTNIYGPTECTVDSSLYQVTAENIKELRNIPIGNAMPNCNLFIVSRWNNLQPVGIPGELLIGGHGVGVGYLNNPELTAEKFYRSYGSYKSNILTVYKTGDLARWQPDGPPAGGATKGIIEFLGRIDQQVKIRGFRIELGEIENRLSRHRAIKEAVVLVRKSGEDKYLCAYIVLKPGDSPAKTTNILSAEMKEFLLRDLPDYMVPAYFVPVDKIPLTPNGKIDRKALPEPGIISGKSYIPPRNSVETKLAAIWGEVLLGINSAKTSIGIDDNFFQMGGHSLKAVIMLSRVHRELNVKIPLAEIFKTPTIKGLADYVTKSAPDKHASIEPAEKKEYYELSSAQKRLYILQQIDWQSTAYNMPEIIPLGEGEAPDLQGLETTFKQLIERHESLRTSFHLLEDQPVQKIHPAVSFKVEERTGEPIWNPGPFDLSKAPLLRVMYLKTQQNQYYLMVDMHHIISDGISHMVLLGDFTALYQGRRLQPLKIQYKDFSEWQNSEKEKENLQHQESFWLKTFAGELPVLEIATDFNRPLVQVFEGNVLSFRIEVGETRALKELALREGATLFMALLALYNIFLARLSGQEDIIIGTPTAGRRHADLESVIGVFINTLALRNYPVGDKSFSEFLKEVKVKTIEAFENQDYPFEDLVDKVVTGRDAGRNPLFDVMIILQNIESGLDSSERPDRSGGSREQQFLLERETSKFDLVLNGSESNEGLNFSLAYSTRLFKRETVERFLTYLKSVFTAVLDDPQLKISNIEIIPEEEKKKILFDFNGTEVEYPGNKTIDRIFAEQVEKIPDHMAVFGHGHASTTPANTENNVGAGPRVCPHCLTYHELNKQSDKLAGLLIREGVRPGSIVAIMMERSVEMMVGIMGILKSGGAYLPIDPHYPQERIDYMLKDSHAKLLIINKSEIRNSKFETNPNDQKINDQNKIFEELMVLNLKNLDFEFVSCFEFRASNFNPSNLAYIIYTSGTTGRPKGVMVRHCNLANLVSGLQHMIYQNYPGGLHVCFVSPYIFDASVKQIFASLLLGHCLYVVPENVRLDGVLLLNYYEKYKIDISDGTPTHLRLFLESMAEKQKEPTIRVKHFLIGGEALPVNLMVGFFDRLGERAPKVTNIYGPTECTVDSALYQVTSGNIRELSNIPIGKSMPNCNLYIVNRWNNLQPVGIPGELLIGGHGVGVGYLNNPELTAEKFYRSYGAYKSNIFIVYRTGDLARWQPDGSIEFLGRIDQQVKIRGFRIELGEIENRLSRHKAVKEAVVLVRKSGEDKYLCAYIVLKPTDTSLAKTTNILSAEMKEFLLQDLPDYMVPSYFVPIDKIPLTPNGKVDHKALQLPVIEMNEEYIPPRDNTEKHLVNIWSDVLDIEKEKIGIENNFFQMGGQSLKAVVMIAKVHKRLNVKISLAEVFKNPTIKGLAQYIKETGEKTFTAIESAEEKDYYFLTSAQKRLYILQQMTPQDTVYNITQTVELSEEPDVVHLEETFKKLIQRHESLRTSFHMVQNTPVQRIHDTVEFAIEYYNLDVDRNSSFSTVSSKDFIRPFDLSSAPLLRVALIKRENAAWLLIVDLHHIISDGISQGILRQDFITFYKGQELLPLKLQYKDYAEWQNSDKEKETLKRQEEYWLKKFEDTIPILSIPMDYTRPVIQSFEGAAADFEIGVEETAILNQVIIKEGVTMYMVLLAIYNIFLAKITGQEDIITGTPVAGRRHADLEKIIGMFVNTIALRNFPHGEIGFKEFLGDVKQKNLEAFENQEYPFEYLVEKIVVKRDAGRNPLFDVMFAFQDLENNKNNMPQQPGSIEGQNLEPTPRNEEESERIRTAKFDLTLVAIHSNDRLSFIFEYCTKLFKTSTIRRFISYFKQIFSLIIQSPGVQLGQLEILSTDEKKQILLDFNRQEIEYPINKSIPQLFHEQVVRTPHSIAFVGFVGQALLSFNFITYDQLNQKVLQTAAIFNQKNISPGSLIGLMAERSLEMIIGMLGILYAGCGYVPLNPKAPASRADYMLSECGANLLLITHSLFNEGNKISTWKGEQIIIESIMEQANPFLLHHSSIIDHHSNHFSNLAYVIFTSGSTGKPKGVPITHANLSPLLHWGYHHLELGPKDRALQNLAYYFDWSVWEIFITLTSGASLWALPDEILLDPEKCVFFINRHGITVLHATPTQFRHLARINREIKSLTYLFIGAEKLTFDLVRHSFDLVNPDCRVFNMYGPTEATIISAVLEIDHVHFKRFESQLSIPIGRGVGNGPLFVLDRYFKLCPINITGELYIGGDGVAAGYLNNPELTAEKFRLQITLITQTNKSEKNKSFAGGQGTVFYKTGDLVRWLPNGYIEFFGRIDQQIKIRGQRIELGEIENQLVKHVDVKEAVVIAKEKDKEEFYLCAYFVPHRQKDRDDILPTTLKEFLGFGLPSYMIPAYFIPIEKIPLTANGKIDLGALPGVEIRLEDNYAAPTNEIERILVRLWAEVLNITNPLEISIDDDFFELGGHSLKATVLTSRIHKELDVHLPLAELFTTPTIRGLAEYIKSAVENVYESIMPVEEKEYYALSFAQKRMYILQQIELNSTAYNMTQITPLPEEVDVNKLGESFKKLIRRHDSLRTSFHMIGDQPVQKIHKEVAFEIERIPVCSQFIRSFDLSQAPLLRVKLIKTTEGKQYLLVDMHHIISDGISSRVLTEDFMAFYEGKELPSLRIQYKDFAQWQNSPKEVARLNRQMLHWLKEFAGEIPSLEIPMDYLRPAIQDFEGDSIHFEISAEETKTLKTTALHGGATLFMILTAAVNILLSKLSGQEEIIIGIPIAGRRHPDLEKIIGMFVNTLVLRSHPLGDRSFQDFLENVKEKTLMAFENQEYPFEDLVDKLSLKRDMGRNPLFDVMFVMQNINSVSTNQDDTSQSVTGQPIQPGVPKEFKNIAQTAKFDLTFFAAEIGLKAVFTLQYCTKIFKKESIERFIHYFKRIVGMVATEPGIKISEIEIISEDEKKRILYDFNGTGAEYPGDKTIHRLFEEQVERTPNSAAIFGRERSRTCTHNIIITYRELSGQSDRLAGLLLEKGVLADTIVGIMIERSIEMIIGIFGILKSAGAYLPIDPGYPQERIDFILKDSNAAILLTDKKEQKNCRFSIVNFQLSKSGRPCFEIRASNFNSANLAYVIYTSGSTGMPKGVMIEHRSVVNRLNWMQKAYPIDAGDSILQKTAFTFDVSVWELFWWSFRGACVNLLEPGDEKIPAAIVRAAVNYRVTTMHFVPSMLNAFLDYLENEQGVGGVLNELRGLTRVFASGEALTPAMVERFYNLFGCREAHGPKLINLYGPTEATVDVSYFNCVPSEKYNNIPIGKPIDNINLYILDKNHRLQPVGVVGELHIGGIGLARGYLNRPDLTIEKFINRSFAGITYKTGDLSRWLPDGNIEFLGRIDYQVKIRGFRIELGEIENRLSGHPAVKEAVLVACIDQSGDARLAAYVVPNENAAFTAHRLLEIEQNKLQGDRPYYELPNGMPIFYLNRNESDFMYREIFEERSYLRHGITLSEGSCIFDIGANIGIFSLFANFVCKGAKDADIYSFEPAPPLYDLLALNTSLYKGNFKIFKNGISARDEEVIFTYYPHASILSGRFANEAEEKETVKAFIHRELEAAGDNRPTEEQIDELLAERLSGVQFKCAMKTVSRVIRENGIERVDLLKIDVEKAELDVLEGIEATDWPKIKQLVIEVHDSGGRLNNIRMLLEKHGYKTTIEQDSMLEETGLYNLYAVQAQQAETREIQGETGGQLDQYGPMRLIDDLKESLKGRLPYYMVPSHFVLLTKMPLTTSGKIDRKALPAPEVKRDVGYKAPTDEIEKKLTGIWSEILDIDNNHISIDAGFFDLGGHSLKATVLASRIRNELNVTVPLGEIFKAPTIRTLGDYIKNSKSNIQRDIDWNLVLIKEGLPGGNHLFFVHDGSGEVEGYVEFCQHLTNNFNCWGIRADRMENPAPHNITIRELAETYIRSMKKIQPGGPYYICGWSLGGTIAIEMARQLVQVNETVGFLAIIDAPAPPKAPKKKEMEFTVQSESAWIQHYLGESEISPALKNADKIEQLWNEVMDYLVARPGHFEPETIKKLIPQGMAQVIPNFQRLGIKELIYYLNRIRTLDNARAKYTPGAKMDMTVHFFAADRSIVSIGGGWSGHFKKRLKIHRINGDHFSIFQAPEVIPFAQKFDRVMQDNVKSL